jgi:hypothetical protein
LTSLVIIWFSVICYIQCGEPAAKKTKADTTVTETKTVKKAMSFVGLAEALKVNVSRFI